MAKKVTIKLVGSVIRSLPKQRATVKALGLGKLNSSITHTLTPQIAGMIGKVAHLVEIKEAL
jgi:large subunit ribosomal protein L30